MLCFSITLLITDYKVSELPDLNLFLIILLAILGIVFLIVGLLQQAHTEIGIRDKKHENDLD